MARVNVEQKALTDPRFDLLAIYLKSNRHEALGRMILVWNECQERCAYHVPSKIIGAIMGSQEGAQWVVDADLGEWAEEKTMVRIKGSEGRVEWLEKKRIVARTNRRQNKTGSSQDNLTINSGLPVDVTATSGDTCRHAATPPAPAPAPALPREMQRSSNGDKKDESHTDDKESIDGHKFTPPTIEEVREYCLQRKNGIDPEYFVNFYIANGWTQGRGKKIRDWKACVITWEKRNKDFEKDKPSRDSYDTQPAMTKEQLENLFRD